MSLHRRLHTQKLPPLKDSTWLKALKSYQLSQNKLSECMVLAKGENSISPVTLARFILSGGSCPLMPPKHILPPRLPGPPCQPWKWQLYLIDPQFTQPSPPPPICRLFPGCPFALPLVRSCSGEEWVGEHRGVTLSCVQLTVGLPPRASGISEFRAPIPQNLHSGAP